MTPPLAATLSPTVVAALVSAAIAGFIALINTLIGLSGGGRNTARQAHRELLGAYLADLGRDLPGVVAASKVYNTRMTKGQNSASWQATAEKHAKGIKDSRGNLRYLLYGADPGFRVLSRVGSWIQHFNPHPEEAKQLLDKADKLREVLERTIAKSYRRGEPPTWGDRQRIRKAADAVAAVWDSRMGTPRFDPEDQ